LGIIFFFFGIFNIHWNEEIEKRLDEQIAAKLNSKSLMLAEKRRDVEKDF
jgi:hypothetical protein